MQDLPTIAPNVVIAHRFWQRFKGLMFTAVLPSGDALLLCDCPSVHTCFMRYTLDVVYLDATGTVVKSVVGLRPWRMSWGGANAVHTLELSAGGIARFGIQTGDTLGFVSQHLVVRPHG